MLMDSLCQISLLYSVSSESPARAKVRKASTFEFVGPEIPTVIWALVAE